MKNIIPLFKKILFYAIPIFILFVIYIILDPFKVIHHYDSYYEDGKFEFTVINRDMADFETFNNQNKELKYNSFILGNSTSFYYRANTWNKFINSSHSIHLNASNESLYGEYIKLKYLTNNKVPVKNVLIVLDQSILNQVDPNKGILFMKHPKWDNTSALKFQFEYVKAFFDRHFFFDYMKYKLFGKYSNTKQYHIWGYNKLNNELSDIYTENLIKKDSTGYYKNIASLFYKRTEKLSYYAPIIQTAQKLLLSKMAKLLLLNKTNFKVIITPHYNQLKFSKSDIFFIKKYFGTKNVFDFSGKNWITNEIGNYYEPNHYKPFVANQILDSIYK